MVLHKNQWKVQYWIVSPPPPFQVSRKCQKVRRRWFCTYQQQEARAIKGNGGIRLPQLQSIRERSLRIREYDKTRRCDISVPTQAPNARFYSPYYWIPDDKDISVCYCLNGPVFDTNLCLYSEDGFSRRCPGSKGVVVKSCLRHRHDYQGLPFQQLLTMAFQDPRSGLKLATKEAKESLLQGWTHTTITECQKDASGCCKS